MNTRIVRREPPVVRPAAAAARGILNGSPVKRLRPPLIILATVPFAVGTDAFVTGGVLPDVAHTVHVSTGAADLLVTAVAIAYAIGAPVLAVTDVALVPAVAAALTACALSAF